MKHLAPWRKPLYALLALLLAADLTYSFLQYLHQPLDGDMAWNVVPAADVAPVLHDPLGFEAMVHGRTYPNPNRFFCHWVFRAYLGDAPLLLQSRFHAIDSVYLACAIAKLLIHLLLLFLLAAYATGSIDVRRLEFIGAAVLITPLFQANGYRSYMGIIDPSTTYSFFYALPCALLLVYFLPVFLRAGADRGLRRHWWWTVPFAFVVCLSGPLNPGAVLVAVLLLIAQPLLSALRNGWAGPVPFLRSLPASYGPYLLPVVVLSLYSLHLGRYNSITIETLIPLADRFAQLPIGLYYLLTQKLGFPVLIGVIGINLAIVSRDRSTAALRIIRTAKWITAFALIYVLLLPFGGYRDYRPHVVRYDTVMPVTLALFFLFATSTLHILNALRSRWYVVLPLAAMAVFTMADEPGFHQDRCERAALEAIAASNEEVVALEQECSVVDWRPIHDPGLSELNAELLLIWRITDRKKLYYNATGQ